MAQFFIHRPIFAWVVALFLMVVGAVSITQLPISQYPNVAPPTIQLRVTYPGASAQTLEDSVLSIIEREMNGSPGLMYMEATAQANGTGTLTLTFENGTDEDIAQVDVQNRLSRATPRLPSAVTQQGIDVDKARSNFLSIIMLSSSDPAITPATLGDYAARNIVPEIQRVAGVGQAQLFGAELAMRIWMDPAKLESFNLSSSDVVSAIQGQNVQISGGAIGELPNVEGQAITATVVAKGQLDSAEAFGDIVLRANADGSTVRLKDVARIELGRQNYATSARLDGQDAVAIGVQLTSSGNAMATASAVHAKMEELAKFFPESVQWQVPYDTSGFVEISIEQVVTTLLEAIVLVFLVMFLFLQNIRYTLIPTIVVPVTLLATFGVLLGLGMSINVLAMFAMVLVIGIVVDDAIIVVENVERIMNEEGLSPKDATIKAMKQISGAIVGVTVVLVSVFVPLAFFGGSVGNIYRQFSVVMATSISFSAFMALSLTPALCATMLKPIPAGHGHAKTGFFGWFNRSFSSAARSYEGSMARVVRHAGRFMLLYLVIIGVLGYFFTKLPTGFLPNEDQGYIVVNVQLPAGASQERTKAVIEQAEAFMKQQPEVDHMVSILGFSFSGNGQNAALMFATLKPWDQRKGPDQSADALAGRTLMALGSIRDAFIFPLSPPAIPELGNSTGVAFRLQDRGSKGHEALLNARNMFMGMAMQSPILTGVRPDGLEDAPQLQLEIDRDKANALGVSFASISSTIATALGSSYVNDFPNDGRLQRVIVQADAPARMQPEDLLKLSVLNSSGKAVPFSSFASTKWVVGPMQTVRYNGYPTMKIEASAAPGYSTGQAMAEMERLAAQLPEGFGFEWTGTSYEERLSGDQMYILFAFSLLAVFLCLAALYESWTIPLSVIMVVPLGLLGVVLASMWGGQINDVYFKIGMITIIGLSAKNAILIIEFAKDLYHDEGRSLVASALQAAHLRFRPILMTSMAFTLGVIPLAIATGASSASQRAIGIGVTGGMISATVLAVLFVPLFFVVVMAFFRRFGQGKPAKPRPAAIEREDDDVLHF
ncbi:MAG: efflux RND transporter permease subunit [Lautropia sp.]|nr:efflux RND transporter permease subunit [Lautropia sp.]